MDALDEGWVITLLYAALAVAVLWMLWRATDCQVQDNDDYGLCHDGRACERRCDMYCKRLYGEGD
jgi:hypothetical protein